MFLSYIIFWLLVVKSNTQNWSAPDLGAPGYTCDTSLMAPSKVKPTSAHSVRPADINLVMAMGDSLTAGMGAASYNFSDWGEFRGLSFGAGGDKGLDQHITIANILQKYNPKLFGQSHGHGVWNDYNVSFLNMAIPGKEANNLPTQALNLINTLKSHPEIDIQNDWKLLNIFIGYNDICNNAYCVNPSAFSPANYASYIRQSLSIVRSQIPRVIVNFVLMCHLEELAYAADKYCWPGHCAGCSNYTREQISQVVVAYQQVVKEIEQNGTFDSTEDFTVVTQPFYTNATLPANETVYRKFWAPDCYHYSQYGHALISSWFWQNMLQPVGSKLATANLNSPSLPLACPDASCPFIRTTKNSQNCQQYYTEPAW